MSPIFDLPYELVSYVVCHLSIEDIRNLSLTSKRFQYLTSEPNITKKLLDTMAKGSPEARRARVSERYAAEFRRLVKRREALSSVQPFTAAIIAVADSWLYENGVLLYSALSTNGRKIRILDLHNSASTEYVIDVRKLVLEAIPESEGSKKFRFEPLYTSDDIVSCLYTHAMPQRKSWLVVFNAKTRRRLTTRYLETAYKIFVRNNDKFLYYGTHSYNGRDGFRRWVLNAYDIQGDKWLKQEFTLHNLVGSDIGSTVCFDIYDGYFYGLSNSVKFEVEETEWTSHYRGFRFPTEQDGFVKIECAPRDKMWRREHDEGPIDDRWTFLRNTRDEKSGQHKIIESRKEWLSGHRSARRTYYMTCFDDFQSPEYEGYNSDSDEQDDDENGNSEDSGEASSLAAVYESYPGEGSTKQGSWRHKLRVRDPEMYHPGDDGDSSIMFTLNKCYIRAYHLSCQTFLDLVDDPHFGSQSQRLRIRGGSRSAMPFSELSGKKRVSAGTQPGRLQERGKDNYFHRDVLFWPPEDDPEHPDPELAALVKMLNPPSHLGGVRGVWDDRSFVYSTGGKQDNCSAVVFLSFDAGICLKGVQPYPGKLPVARPAGEWMDWSPNGFHTTSSAPRGFSPASQPDPHWPEVQHTGHEMSMENHPKTCDDTSPSHWCVTERAMYRDIGTGYHFFPATP